MRERAQSEFAWSSKTRIKAQDDINEGTQKNGRAMTAKLYNIFAGE
jgi:hypothetical protein